VSVLVETGHDGRAGRAALAALAAHTLPRDQFDVIAIIPEEVPDAAAVRSELAAWPAPGAVGGPAGGGPGSAEGAPVAFIACVPGPGGHFTPAAVTAATREHFTVIKAGDWVSPAYLAELDRLAAADRAVITPIASVTAGGGVAFAHGVNREALRLSGRAGTWADVPLAASPGIGRSVPTAAAAAAPRPSGTQPGWEAAWWALVFYEAGLGVAVAEAATRAVYYRADPSAAVNPTAAVTDAPKADAAGGTDAADDTADAAADADADGRDAAVTAAIARASRAASHLEAFVDAMPADALPFARALADEQGVTLGRALRDNPARHAEAAAALTPVTGGGIGLTLLQAANRALTDRLVVSYAFPPFLDTSGIVVAKRLLRENEPFDLITHNLAPKSGLDERLGELVAPLEGRVTTVAGPPRTHREASLEKWCREGVAAVREREWEFGPYRRMYSRSMWPASHVLAALIKSRQRGLEWTAEFSDPLLVDSRGQVREAPLWDSDAAAEIAAAVAARGLPLVEDRGFFGWLEGVVYALADRIVFTNPNQRAFMAHYPARAGGPFPAALAARVDQIAVISPHPVPPEAYYTRASADGYDLEPGVVNIGYFGVFYATRGVGDILEAFSQLSAAERRRVRLHVFTDKPDGVADAVARAGLEDAVRVAGLVPYLEFLALARRFDWLVVADARVTATHGMNPYLPSKLSDYRGAGSRIWGLVEPGSCLSREPLDAKTELGDVAAAAEALRHMITDR
jgi:hypothetical protein